MGIITLTSDFGIRDYRLAVLKGCLSKSIPLSQVVDITHEISPFNLSEALYVLQNSYNHFPKGTVHWIGVDASIHGLFEPILVEAGGHFFLSTNNGLLSMFSKEVSVQHIHALRYNEGENSLIFWMDLACKIVNNEPYQPYLNGTTSLKEMTKARPIYSNQKSIVGQVIYIDGFGNVVTNISEAFFRECQANRSYIISANGIEFKHIMPSYTSTLNKGLEIDRFGDRFALFNSAGFLELAIYKSNPKTVGGANTLLGLRLGDEVYVNFLG